jgi:hypothetical protein
MNSQSFPPRSRLRTDTAQSKIQGPVNNVCRGRHEGLDVGTKNSDFPVEGELFPLTSPFIERTERHCPWLPGVPSMFDSLEVKVLYPT